jgi:hypothetical protein
MACGACICAADDAAGGRTGVAADVRAGHTARAGAACGVVCGAAAADRGGVWCADERGLPFCLGPNLQKKNAETLLPAKPYLWH